MLEAFVELTRNDPKTKTDRNNNPKSNKYAVQNDTEIKFNIVLYI